MREKVLSCIVGGMLGAGLMSGAVPQPFFQSLHSPDALQGLRRLTNGDWQIDLAPQAGRFYLIESSSNGVHWATLTNFVADQRPFQWIDSASHDWPMRLYRVVPRGGQWIQRRSQGAFEMLFGLEPGPEYVIEASSDLRSWVPIERFISLGPVMRFTHRPSGAAERLFYRARPTGRHRIELQADGQYVLWPTQTWGTAYLIERSANLRDWSLAQSFIGLNTLEHVRTRVDSPLPVAYRITAAPVNDVYDAFIILGQSNAVGVGDLANREPSDPSVWMFGNDYQFKIAYEPIDDSENQVDGVSADPSIRTNSIYGHSWGLRAAKGVTGARTNQIILIPCARGSTVITNWFPATDRFDRSTLFGSANYRRSIAASGGLKGIWYYGHETSSDLPHRLAYIQDWQRLVSELRRDCGPVPIIYAQLALTTASYLTEQLHEVAEMQRLMETDNGDTNALPNHHMVVTFDLPMQDYIHLSRAAVDVLADRFALATRQHVYGEAINGTGPRLVSLTHPEGDKSKIKVQFNRPINQAFNNYDHQFRVCDGNTELPLRRASRDADATSVLLTLQEPATGLVTVSYGGRTVPATNMPLANVVKDADGLPAPMFRRLPVR